MEVQFLQPNDRGLAGSIDRIQIQPWLTIFRVNWPAWRFFVILGILLGILVIAILGLLSGIPFWIAGLAGIAAGLGCAAVAIFMKALRGFENYTFYHYQLVLLTSGAGAVISGLLRLSHLDLLCMGLATSLAVGRIGCLMAGCCYGRPHRWGICYREEHGKFGFPAHLLGVRLLPVQLFESFGMGIVILVGITILLSDRPAGSILAWYLISYSFWRFFLEFWRGDLSRRYWLGLSEAQWTSFLVVLVLVLLEGFHILPGQTWHGFCLVTQVIAFLWIHSKRDLLMRIPQYKFLHPRHIREIARAIDHAAHSRQALASYNGMSLVVSTSLGVQLSSGIIRDEAGQIRYYAISTRKGAIDRETAQAISKLILQLRHPESTGELLPGGHGVYHLLVHDTVRH